MEVIAGRHPGIPNYVLLTLGLRIRWEGLPGLELTAMSGFLMASWKYSGGKTSFVFGIADLHYGEGGCALRCCCKYSLKI